MFKVIVPESHQIIRLADVLQELLAVTSPEGVATVADALRSVEFLAFCG